MKRLALMLSLLVLLLSAACTATPRPSATATDAAPVLPLPATEQPRPLPAETQPPTASLDDQAFDQALAQAFADRDRETLRTYMKDRFSLALDASELREVTAEEALQFLAGDQLAEGARPVAQFQSDVPALLKGTDPLAIWGPVAQVVRALHVTGLGSNAMDEAVLVVGKDGNGQPYWHGILLPTSGSFKSYGTPPSESFDTDVKYLRTRAEVNLRTGPGETFDVLGPIPAGEIAQVVGISADGAWYRIQCTSYLTGLCWVSADPALTEPTSGE